MARNLLARYFPTWVLLAIVLILMLPNLLLFTIDTAFNVAGAAPGVVLGAVGGVIEFAGNAVGDVAAGVGDVFAAPHPYQPNYAIAPLFTREVEHWASNIGYWAELYDLDPNLLATVMQIESCGHPTVSSHAGAQGLFQVMPFHFSYDENQLDPDTNARRGASVLNDCLIRANDDAGLAMACYNGGPSVLSRDFSSWLSEPQRYYRWGTGIYADAQRGSATSATLDQWLAAGGSSLCDRASSVLGIN